MNKFRENACILNETGCTSLMMNPLKNNELSLMDFGQAVGLKLNPENRFEEERA